MDRCQSLESQQPEVWNALTKKREGGAESAPHEVVSSHDRCSIFGISIWKIIENTVEQQEGSNGKPSGADDWDDPVHFRSG